MLLDKIDRKILRKSIVAFCLLSAAILISGCETVGNLARPTVRSLSLRDVPANKLSFRFETDVLVSAEIENKVGEQPEKLTAIQADFDARRAQDSLSQTIQSPDQQRVLAVYQNVADEKDQFRLDVYDSTGKFIRNITPENLALIFPDAIAWTPNSENVAFIASRRLNSPMGQEIVQEAPRPVDLNENQNTNVAPAEALASPSLAPAQIPAFQTEQIYLCNRDGGETMALTKVENTIHFSFQWSPDGSRLAALAIREHEWQALEARAKQLGEVFQPAGRLYSIEKNGQMRRLDDIPTVVSPAWSPDSSKVATAFDKSVRIYDALGNAPTAAAIDLQTPLLLSSKLCDEKLAANQFCVDATTDAINQNNRDLIPTSEPVSFLPIVALRWTEDKTLYLETGFFKDYLDGKSFRSYLRWHRLNFSPQAVALD